MHVVQKEVPVIAAVQPPLEKWEQDAVASGTARAAAAQIYKEIRVEAAMTASAEAGASRN